MKCLPKINLYQQNDSFEQKKEKIETEPWEGLTKAFHLSIVNGKALGIYF